MKKWVNFGNLNLGSLATQIKVPPSARKKFWPSNQAGEKEGGWGEGIFARLFCAEGAVGWEAFPLFGIKPNIKAKQFSIPFKRKRVARKIKELKRKLFCFAPPSGGRSRGAGQFRSLRRPSGFGGQAKWVRTAFSNCDSKMYSSGSLPAGRQEFRLARPIKKGEYNSPFCSKIILRNLKFPIFPFLNNVFSAATAALDFPRFIQVAFNV